jgi:hypothetical protein
VIVNAKPANNANTATKSNQRRQRSVLVVAFPF